MRRNRGWQGLGTAFAFFVLGSSLASAHAGPITVPGYTVTDLAPARRRSRRMATGMAY